MNNNSKTHKNLSIIKIASASDSSVALFCTLLALAPPAASGGLNSPLKFLFYDSSSRSIFHRFELPRAASAEKTFSSRTNSISFSHSAVTSF